LDRLKGAVESTGGVLGVFSVPSQFEVDAAYLPWPFRGTTAETGASYLLTDRRPSDRR
jgi:hypothetical protein